jgi:glucose/arabinose dehydrogenase
MQMLLQILSSRPSAASGGTWANGTRSLLFIAIVTAVTACGRRGGPTTSATGGCDASLKLPDGFCATVFADSAGPVRHIAVRSNGDVIAGVLDQRRQPGGVLVLRDTNHDGHADREARFGDEGVHGVILATDSVLFVSTATAVVRYRFGADIQPGKRVDTVITGLARRAIPSHSLAYDNRGNLFVNVGANSNGCAKEQPHGRGADPCPELETAGGIWRFPVDKTHQTYKEGVRAATGLHNAVAITINPRDTLLYAVSHDRDALHDLYPELYNDAESATRPAEEFVRVPSMHADFGWPYCYYDYALGHRVVAPEYGGDKQTVGRCERLVQPLAAFPAHWSPMAVLFYTGKMFPAKYQAGAFVAFHGSANRAPLPQEGYHVAFVPFKDGLPFGDYEIFADGFAGGMLNPEGALHRPSGLAQGADGALYVSDDKGGRIWKITYKK